MQKSAICGTRIAQIASNVSSSERRGVGDGGDVGEDLKAPAGPALAHRHPRQQTATSRAARPATTIAFQSIALTSTTRAQSPY